MRTLKGILAAWLITTAATSHASIDANKQINIDLTNPAKAATKATWSEPDRIAVSPDGLGWDGDSASSRDGWIQTKPLALGLSWRPTYAISVRVTIQPRPREITLNSGQKATPYGGDVYIRYSPDFAHWSSWQVLQRAEPQSNEEKKNPGRHYGGTIRVPYVERDEYSKLLSEYSKQDVPWKSDEAAAVRWILERQPDFFSKHLPFIGYAEFRYEGGFYGGQRFVSFKADVSYGMSGEHYPPKDDEAYKDRDSKPWSFMANERDAKVETPPRSLDQSPMSPKAKSTVELLREFKEEKVFWKQGEVGEKLIAIGDKSIVPEIAQMLASDDRAVRCNAGRVLARLGDSRGLDAVIAELKDTSDRLTKRTRSDGKPDVPGQITQDRYYAAGVLGQIGDRQAVPALIEALKDKAIGYQAAIALGEIGDPRAAGALKEMLKSADSDDRLWAGYGLAGIGDPAGVPAVAEFLKSPEWTNRCHAAEALGKFRDKRALGSLIESLKEIGRAHV
jgi:hypothetical protein